MKAGILTIGDEILIGQIIDSNSTWIAKQMTDAGFEVVEMATVGDDATQIKTAIRKLSEQSDIVLITGGLGPTKDDITKNTLCDYFNTKLVFNQDVLDNIENIISNRAILNELTRGQAYVPESCTVIQNRVGTAPITWFEENGKTIVSMPGVPYEMKYVMTNEIIPRLCKKFEADSYLKNIFLVVGYPESNLAIHLTKFEENLPKGFGLAYLPSLSLVKLRLFVRGNRTSELEEQSDKLRALLGKAIICEEDITIEEVLGRKLLDKGLTIATAESCTGGNIAHLITSISGSSQYFLGSAVSYSNDMKINVLKVNPQDIEEFGAVSENVVQQMALGVKQLIGSDCVIATSGIAGPSGGSDEKPVGTVCISTICKDKIETKLYNIGKYRLANITRASNIGMLQLLEML